MKKKSNFQTIIIIGNQSPTTIDNELGFIEIKSNNFIQLKKISLIFQIMCVTDSSDVAWFETWNKKIRCWHFVVRFENRNEDWASDYYDVFFYFQWKVVMVLGKRKNNDDLNIGWCNSYHNPSLLFVIKDQLIEPFQWLIDWLNGCK